MDLRADARQSALEFPAMQRPAALGTALGALALLALGLLAAGGAAARPAGLWLGAPAVAAGTVVVLAVLALLAVAGRAVGVASGLLVVPALLLAGAPIPAFSGPPLFALALAGVVAALSLRAPNVPRAIFVPALLAVYALGAQRTQARVGPDGDEPHYLMVADSLIRDGDLDLARDYAEGRYRSFHPEPLEPHFRIRGRHGEIYSLHAVGLSLLVLPAYAAFGYAGASFFMALLAALLMREIRGLLASILADKRLADGLAWAIALSPPVVHYAGLVFTEIPAALCVAVGLRGAPRLATFGLAGRLGWGAALAFLPWLNVRYAPFPALILLYALAQRPPRRAVLAGLAPLVLSAAAIAAFHWALYGFVDPRGVYGRRPELALAGLLEGLPGLLLDQEFGLLVYAPVFALAVPGIVALARRNAAAAATVAGLAAVVLLTAGTWPMWRGGFNPPARFLVPIVPALALAVGAALCRGLSSPAALLVGWGLWTGLGGLAAPERVHRDRDGTAPFFRENAGALEWTRLLPGFVLGEEDRRGLATVWALALGGACLARGRRPSAGGLVAASGGLLLAAGAAARLGDGRADGREAVHLVGRPGLAVPGWSVSGSVVAAWGRESLGWGPLYEPHRHPDGATLADRIRVASGRIEIDLDPGLAPATPPVLIVRLEVQPPREARFELRITDGRLTGEYASPTGAGRRPLRLALLGGSPLVLREIRLSALDGSPRGFASVYSRLYADEAGAEEQAGRRAEGGADTHSLVGAPCRGLETSGQGRTEARGQGGAAARGQDRARREREAAGEG